MDSERERERWSCVFAARFARWVEDATVNPQGNHMMWSHWENRQEKRGRKLRNSREKGKIVRWLLRNFYIKCNTLSPSQKLPSEVAAKERKEDAALCVHFAFHLQNLFSLVTQQSKIPELKSRKWKDEWVRKGKIHTPNASFWGHIWQSFYLRQHTHIEHTETEQNTDRTLCALSLPASARGQNVGPSV